MGVPEPAWVLAGRAGDEGGDDVGGVAVEGDSSSVVTHCGARVGVAGGFLDVTEGDAGVEGGGDERVTQGVGSDSFRDPGTAGDATHDAGGGVTVEPFPVRPEEDRAFAAFTDGEVNGASGPWGEGNEDGLGAFAEDGQGAMPAFETECFDVGAGGFRRRADR